MFGRDRHLSGEALSALVDGPPAAVPPAAQAHFRRCAQCRERTQELRDMRRLLQQSASDELVPARDIVSGAVKRLRVRRQTIGNVNEFFGLLFGIIAGFATLLSIEEKDGTRDG